RVLLRIHPPFAALVASVALCVFVRSAAAHLSDGSVDHWPWLPLWFCALVVAAAVAGPVVALRRGAATETVHRWVLSGFVGSVLIVMATSALPGNIGQLQGFDDMQSVTGADLMSRGYFPWRDVTFIHGVFEDGLRSWPAFALFEHTLWATWAMAYVLWLPLCWSGMYLLGVWATRGRLLPSLVMLASVVYVSTQVPGILRWCWAPFVFILLGEALRRRSPWWTGLLTFVLFWEAVLVPEASFQVIAVLVVLLSHDLSTRAAGETRWRALRTTRWFVVVGGALTLVWSAFLALHSTLVPFLEYYVIFGPGHVESGALPFGRYSTERYEDMFTASTALVVLTLLIAGWIWVSRRAVTHYQWVMFAAALMAGLYGEKALGRFDDGHLLQAIYVTLMLAGLWLARLLVWSDDALTRRLTGRPAPAPTTPLISVLVLVLAIAALQPLRAEATAAPSSNKGSLVAFSLPKIGYAVPETYDPALLQDLGTIVDTFGGEDRTIFDFTNSPGFFWYLLGLDPTTSYFHVSMAVPDYAQEDLVDQLEEDPPALVAFDGPFGLPSWDGVSNEVRHHEVSRYLLDGWTPILRSRDVLFMLRKDLVAERPELPTLLQEPVTDNLYFSSDECSWGKVPNFLSPQQGQATGVEVAPSQAARRVVSSGWAMDPAGGDTPVRILLAAGDRVVATEEASIPRPDVAAAVGSGSPEDSGFALQTITRERGLIRVYAVDADGTAHPLGDRGAGVDELVLPDDSRVPVGTGRAAQGAVDVLKSSRGRVSEIDVPAGVDLNDVGSLTFATGGKPFGHSSRLLTDSLTSAGGEERSISFDTLPVTDDSINVRVGACLQWHGYTGDELYLFSQHGRDAREVEFVVPDDVSH
ncbi:MAG TPA: hypothetical protein PL137_08855, partial [Nocardioides sp.]|nr:hypothetical protein [Nocardioides sp.]